MLLLDTNKNGKISKNESMKFMSAEFDRLDVDKSGELDPHELLQSQVSVRHARPADQDMSSSRTRPNPYVTKFFSTKSGFCTLRVHRTARSKRAVLCVRWQAWAWLEDQLRKKSLAFWISTSRLTSEIALVSGIPFGQTSTQFCANPHS
jgi:hypothetical protein